MSNKFRDLRPLCVKAEAPEMIKVGTESNIINALSLNVSIIHFYVDWW